MPCPLHVGTATGLGHLLGLAAVCRGTFCPGQHHPGQEGVEVFVLTGILSRRKAMKGKGPNVINASGEPQSVPAERKVSVMAL